MIEGLAAIWGYLASVAWAVPVGAVIFIVIFKALEKGEE